MASRLLSPAAVNLHYNPNSSIITATTSSITSFSSCQFSASEIISLQRSSIQRSSNPWCGRCGATSPRPPSPPESGPPPGDEEDSNSGSLVSFSRIQESVQIFFAVFFWMSLFFWSSVWDGRNNGKSNKGPKFWK
ncbi:hypothetical protein LXL04_009160 [Taraxacum kok-saghyz]